MLLVVRRAARLPTGSVYPCFVSWVDLVIAGIAMLAAWRGYARGAVVQIAGLVGLIAGLLAGTLVAPTLATSVTRASWRPLLALGIVIAGAMLGSFAGQLVGSIASRFLRALRLGLVDRVLGVAVGVAGALVVCWLVAGLLVSTTWGSLAGGIQSSVLLRSLDHILPPVPAIEARVQVLFRNENLPNVFATVIAPTLPFGTPTPRLGPSTSPVAGPAAVVKVLASGGCSSSHEGTAFFVGPHEAVTNAHVVAGATAITLGGVRAVVALFDPRQDLAILRVTSVRETSLDFLAAPPAPGTHARIVGFPLDASRTLTPAVVRGELSGEGRDIYDRALLMKSVLVLTAQVQPGNSGSPVLVGVKVAGVIVSKSLSQGATAYAIPDGVVRADLARTPARGVASTQGCAP